MEVSCVEDHSRWGKMEKIHNFICMKQTSNFICIEIYNENIY
jgi:hypothetical protein